MTTRHPAATQDDLPLAPTDPVSEPPEITAEPVSEAAPEPAAEPAPASAAEPAGSAEPTSTRTDSPAEPEAAAEAAPSPEPPGTTGRDARSRGGFTRAKLLGALGAMLVVAVAATAVLQWVSAARAQEATARLEAERALRVEVSGAAGAFSRALLSYDYQNLQTTRATLAAQATGDFLATYDAAFGGAMAQVIVKLKATSQATVREVYLAGVDEATAHAIVVVDQQVNTSEAIRSVKDSHLKISLVKEKGTWKINEVTVLGAASEDQYDLDGKPAKE
ncbi:hypothetical protein AB0K18_03335 [Nonomuraea sp. NPDC049421]|uniref:hypothetical protein n=1 Tax=Nonomuraea sp. NPDC049421 TaxID=3155275 RepID=UPI00343A5619